MNRYSKIKLGNTHKSRSMDFSDLHHQNFTEPQQPPNQITSKNTHLPNLQEEVVVAAPPPPPDNHNNTNGASDLPPKFGSPKLTRNGSVSSSSSIKSTSNRFKFNNHNNKQIEGMQSVVKRAFSMRRSSSVSERYCRIHDQCVTLASPIHDDDDDIGEGSDAMQTSRSVEKKKKLGYGGGGFFKACKRFLRL